MTNVYQNSHTLKPLIYKWSGVWGNHEGSMLLWVLILALFGAGVAVFSRNLPDDILGATLAVQAMIAAAFLAFLLFASNPFLRLAPAPFEGRDLNPILQDPGPRDSSAAALSWLCWLFHRLLFRSWGVDCRAY